MLELRWHWANYLAVYRVATCLPRQTFSKQKADIPPVPKYRDWEAVAENLYTLMQVTAAEAATSHQHRFTPCTLRAPAAFSETSLHSFWHPEHLRISPTGPKPSSRYHSAVNLSRYGSKTT